MVLVRGVGSQVEASTVPRKAEGSNMGVLAEGSSAAREAEASDVGVLAEASNGLPVVGPRSLGKMQGKFPTTTSQPQPTRPSIHLVVCELLSPKLPNALLWWELYTRVL